MTLAAVVALFLVASSARGQTNPSTQTAAPATEQAKPAPATTPVTKPAPPPKEQPKAPPKEPPKEPVTRVGAVINQELDKPLDLDQRDRPLPEVLAAISERTGIVFDVGDETYALLPYGRKTPISATITNTPLRRTLEAITAKLGLTFVPGETSVEIRPLPALVRAGRRAGVQEIAGLDLLAAVRLDSLEDRPTASKLLEAVDLKLESVDAAARDKGQPEPGFRVENRLDDRLRDRPVFLPRGVTLLGALEAVAQQTDATWYPAGASFVVLPKIQWVRQRLDERRVTLRYDDAASPSATPVARVLNDLERASGVAFAVEPGALGRVPEADRAVRLSFDGVTVREALERLGGATGLGYVVTADGVYVWNKDPLDPNATVRRDAEQPLLAVNLGGGGYVLLYPSDLSAEQRQRLEGRRREIIDRVGALLDGPPAAPDAPAEPATAPATQAAG